MYEIVGVFTPHGSTTQSDPCLPVLETATALLPVNIRDSKLLRLWSAITHLPIVAELYSANIYNQSAKNFLG